MFTRRVITVVLVAITALTFAFGFGNVWALGRSLDVPSFVAPMVGPAVDLSVAGLLIGIRHLSMAGVPRDQLRPARILLIACGTTTLALNIAGPVTADAYGRAAFDSVGPGLLIGWAETGPAMLRFLYARPSIPAAAPHGSEARPALAVVELPAGSVPQLTSLASGTTSNGPDASQAGRGATRQERRDWTNCYLRHCGLIRRTASGITGRSPLRRCASRCGSAPCAHAHSCSGSATPAMQRQTAKLTAIFRSKRIVMTCLLATATTSGIRHRARPVRRWPPYERRGTAREYVRRFAWDAVAFGRAMSTGAWGASSAPSTVPTPR